MEQCKKCRYFKYVNKGLLPNYAGCEKCSVTIGNPYKCTAYKRISLWKRIYSYINTFRLWLYVKTNRKIDLGVSHMLKNITDKLIGQNLDVE